MKPHNTWIIIGSELSPFTLKLQAMCHYVGLPYRILPESGTTFENIRYLLRKEQLARGRIPLHWPPGNKLDEFPLVPYLFGPNGENLYDSSAIAEWLDQHAPLPFQRPKLIPAENEAAQFLCHLIDEFADEFVLYLVHHNRWQQSAKNNNAGDRLAAELASLLGPLQPCYSEWFSRRQVKRLPYLFSVAERGATIEGLPIERQPPDRPGFPATHRFLDHCYLELLDILESLLKNRPYLITSQFTVADASLYGQLAINLKDPTTAALIANRAPGVDRWLHRIGSQKPPSCTTKSSLQDNTPQTFDHLKPLLNMICEVYVPLMHQNTRAWSHYNTQGETLFNEKAFWKNRALYDGSLRGTPFRSVVKTFQVRSWLTLRSRWDKLSQQTKLSLANYLPAQHGLDRDD